MAKKIRILTYGTFDLFHVGHVRLLKRLRDLGDELIVGCSTDEFNKIKGKNTVMPYESRKEILLSCKYVNSVFAEDNWDQKRNDVKRTNADIFAMGDDWSGHFDHLEDICKVVYLPRTSGISSTKIKQFTASQLETELASVIKEVENIKSRLSSLLPKAT